MNADLASQRRGRALVLTISREAKRNALSGAVVEGIAEGLEQGVADKDVAAIVITGAGDKAFCAGADLDPTSAPFQMEAGAARLAFADLMRAMIACEKPIVARVNGACMAGGMGLLGAADIAIASDAAKFGLPEVGIGVFPMMVAAILQNRLDIPARKLAEMCLTGDPITADEALSLGFVNRVVPSADLDAETDALVEKLASRSPTALRLGKRALTAMLDMNWDAALAHAESQIRLVALTQDAREGLVSFAEKRAPNWTGN
jgi:enoyl-CoA hydratase/carnithine racemase